MRAVTQSTRSCWSLACRKNFLIPALMTVWPARMARREKLSGKSLKGKCGVTHFIHWAEHESSLGTKYSATCAMQLVLNWEPVT